MITYEFVGRKPGWLLEMIRAKWQSDFDKWTRNLSRGLYEGHDIPLAARAIRSTVRLLEMTSGAPFDAARARREIAKTYARIEREFEETSR